MKIVEIHRFGIKIQEGSITYTLTDEKMIQMLTRLNIDDHWGRVICRLGTAGSGTDVAEGRCPFPTFCDKWFTCTKVNCRADTCSNGYAYRMS